jgi:hypothetical protein
MSVQDDVLVEHSSVESVNSALTQSGLSGTSSLAVNPGATPSSRIESTSTQQNHKKVIAKLYVWKLRQWHHDLGFRSFISKLWACHVVDLMMYCDGSNGSTTILKFHAWFIE